MISFPNEMETKNHKQLSGPRESHSELTEVMLQ